MKLKVVYFPKSREIQCIKDIIGTSICSKECLWGGKKSNELLDIFSSNGGFTLRLNFEFSIKDYSKYSNFILHSKYIYRESDSVYDKNFDYVNDLQIHHETNFGAFKSRKKVYVDKVKPIFDRIWAMETSENHLVPKGLAIDMEKSFKGLSLISVYHYKTNDINSEWVSFDSGVWLEKLNFDETCELKKKYDDFDYLIASGLLSAEERYLSNLPDIFHLPQADMRGDSKFVVSKDLFVFWIERGIKSFWIKPLLNTNSEQYKEYIELWRNVKEAISINPLNEIEFL